MPEHTGRMADALEAVLLFHSGKSWTFDTAARWLELTGTTDATTRSLCDFIRKVRREAGIIDPEKSE